MLLRIVLACMLLFPLAAESPPPPGVSDAQIEAELRQKLAKSVIGKDGFTMRVKGGTVYWEGSTHVAQHKGAATRMAKSSGARRVVNQIRVIGGKAPAKGIAVPKVPKPTAQLQELPKSVPPGNSPGPVGPGPQRVAVRWVPARH